MKRLEDLVAITPQEFRERRDIDVRLSHGIVEIDLEGKYVVVRNEGGKEFEMNYDKLLIATGAHARVPPLEGVDLKNIFTLHWLEDGERIKNLSRREAPKKVAVGAGYIGLETAEAFRELDWTSQS